MNKFLIIISVLIFLVFSGCERKKGKIKIPPRPIQSGVIIQKNVPIYIDTFGTFTANLDVNIISEVTGVLLETHINDGDFVTNRQLLFTIDPREFKAELDEAKATLTENVAQLKLKNDDLARNKQLFETQVISAEAYEQSQTFQKRIAAQVTLDQAQVEFAQIQYDYCFIRAPMDSRAGATGFDPGNLITADTGLPLLNLKQLNPLTLDLTVPEKYLFDVKAAMVNSDLKVEIFVEGSTNIFKGTVTFFDNKIDDKTGTLFLEANVPNKNQFLWPGQFVHVKLITGIKKNAILAPYEAVQLGRQGNYLFVISQNKTVEMRMVKTGQRQGNLIVVESGVKPGEKVVTIGQLGLYSGASIVETHSK